MSCAVAIFVKTPGLSPIKASLANEIGEAAAGQCYRLTLACIAESVQMAGLKLVYAVAEPDGLYDGLWKYAERIWSGEKETGARMRHVHESLLMKYDSVLLTRPDYPALSPHILRAAARESRHGHVVGPAPGGDFYLYGGRKTLAPEVWASPRWKTEYAFQDFVRQLDENILRLRTLSCLNDLASLRRFAAGADAGAGAFQSPAQKKLMAWAKTIAG